MPAVSVLLATCNRAELLPEALDSLLAQTRPPDQMLVVDDGSIDATPSVLERYRGRIEVLRTPGGGKARALNLALPRVRGDYLWIFDDDDLALPDALERHLAFLATRPEVEISFAGMYFQAAGGTPVERQLPKVAPEETFVRLFVHCFLQQQGMLVATRCYREVGPFAEELVRSQDYEMALRLTRRFHAARLPGPPTFVYRQHAGQRGLGSAQFESAENDRTWLHFDRIIVRRLVAEVELWEYLPGRERGSELSPRERRQALLQRLCVAVRRGLWDLGLADLAAAFKADPVSTLGELELAAWRQAFEESYGRRVGLEAFRDDTSLSDRIADLCRGQAGQCLRDLLAERLAAMARWGLAHAWPPELSARVMADAERLAPGLISPPGLGGSP